MNNPTSNKTRRRTSFLPTLSSSRSRAEIFPMKGVVVISLLSTLSNFVASQNPDYTCDVTLDYGEGGTCPKEKIGDGQCDYSPFGDGDLDCVQQDCLDCNKNCKCEVGQLYCIFSCGLILFRLYTECIAHEESLLLKQRYGIQCRLFGLSQCRGMLLVPWGCHLSEFLPL